jgi:hypothetical protein
VQALLRAAEAGVIVVGEELQQSVPAPLAELALQYTITGVRYTVTIAFYSM